MTVSLFCENRYKVKWHLLLLIIIGMNVKTLLMTTGNSYNAYDRNCLDEQLIKLVISVETSDHYWELCLSL